MEMTSRLIRLDVFFLRTLLAPYKAIENQRVLVLLWHERKKGQVSPGYGSVDL